MYKIIRVRLSWFWHSDELLICFFVPWFTVHQIWWNEKNSEICCKVVWSAHKKNDLKSQPWYFPSFLIQGWSFCLLSKQTHAWMRAHICTTYSVLYTLCMLNGIFFPLYASKSSFLALLLPFHNTNMPTSLTIYCIIHTRSGNTNVYYILM